MIIYTISSDDFWGLCEERGWMTRADAIEGRKIDKYVSTLTNRILEDMDDVINALSGIVERHSKNIDNKNSVKAALLTIVRLQLS